MGLSFWRSGIIAAEMADGAVSLVGSEHPPTDKDPMRSVERFQDFLAALAPPKAQKRRLRRRA